jgi:hypothetical protein
MNRRTLIKSLAFTGAAGALGRTATARLEEESAASFRFLYFTDTHIEPELNAAGAAARASSRWIMNPRSLPSVAAI